MTFPIPPWRLDDLLDYESFLDADEGESAEVLRSRDREIFTRVVAAAASATPRQAERRGALRLWLEERRRAARAANRAETVLPGEAFAQTSATLRFLLALAGVLLGGGAAWAALTYTRGGEPINALAFFCEFALLQVAILLIALFAFVGRRFLPELPSLARLLWRVAAAGAGRLWRRASARVAGTTRAKFAANWGFLRGRHGLYGRVGAWHLLRLTQVFAIAFNLGVLGAMAGRLSLQQLYFGWEATFPSVNAPNVHRLVSAAAAPWTALGIRAGAAPSLQAVERSQNFRLTAERPDPASSPAWGAFLLAAATFYGLLPRVLLAFVASVGERMALRRLHFADARSEALALRLQTPALTVASEQSRAVAARPPVAPGVASTTDPLPAQVAPERGAVARRLVFNLTGIPLPTAGAANALGNPATIDAVLAAGSLDPAEDDRAFAEAVHRLGSDAALRPVALLGAWTPPMRATHLLLDRIRAAAGPERLIEIALVGKPHSTDAVPINGSAGFRRVETAQRELWASAVRARGDAYLSLAPSE